MYTDQTHWDKDNDNDNNKPVSAPPIQQEPGISEVGEENSLDFDSASDSDVDNNHEGPAWIFPGSNVGPDEYCPCGNPGHIDMERWYQGYVGRGSGMSGMSVMEALDKDNIDQEIIDKEVSCVTDRAQVSLGFCANCHQLFDSWPSILLQSERKVRWQLFRGTVEFEASYRNGCRFCTLLVQTISHFSYSIHLYHKMESRLKCLAKNSAIYISVLQGRDIGLQLNLPGIPPDSGSCHLQMIASLVDASRLFTGGDGATPIRSANFPAPLDLTKRWLDACLATHACCSAKSNNFPLPARFLDVGERTIKLVETKDWKTRPKYATLSHCWGKCKFLNLTTKSLRQFKAKVPVKKLSKTFKDAIKITQELKLHYLWIDALCIIQDSALDWNTESSLMSSVYGCSTINIAAAGASDGDAGCFVQSAEHVGKVSFEATINECVQTWAITPCHLQIHSIAESPLANRAWTLQERLLSPRTVYFAQTEIFWECKLLDACESFPEGLPRALAGHPSHRPKKALSEIWHTVISLYTQASLTYASDKMIAISGIARAAQRESPDQYLAGMWRKNIETLLCWRSRGNLGANSRSETYRAPSWSWASVDGPVDSRVYSNIYSPFAHVLDASVTPAGHDIFGHLCGGTLTISYSVMLTGRIYAVNDELLKQRRGHRHYLEIVMAGSNDSFTIDGAYPDTDEDGELPACLLPISLYTIEMPNGGPKHNMYHHIIGLILRATNATKGEYSRVGMFNIWDFQRKARKKHYEPFLNALAHSGSAIAELSCAEILDSPKYTNERYLLTIV